MTHPAVATRWHWAIWLCGILSVLTGASAAADPPRAHTLIVAAGAGGGTDATARAVARVLAARRGVPLRVVGRPDGTGLAAHRAIASAARDGTTLAIVTGASVAETEAVGLGNAFTPLWLYNVEPMAVHVRADAPYPDLNGLIAVLRDEPGTLRAAGGAWYRMLEHLLQAEGIPRDAVLWAPSQAAVRALDALAAGEVDLVVCSDAEADAHREAGVVRSLNGPPDAVALTSRMASDGTPAGVPPAAWHAWRGVVGPPDLPTDVVEVLAAAMEEAAADPDLQAFMAGRGYRLVWRGPEAFADFLGR